MSYIFDIAEWRSHHVSSVLTENDAKIDQTKKIIAKAFEGAVDLEGNPLDLEAPVKREDQQVDHNPNTKMIDYLVHSFRDYFGLMSFDRPVLKLLPIVAKIAFVELNFQRTDADLNKLQNLRRVVNQAIQDTNSQEYNWLLGRGLDATYQEVYDHFREQLNVQDKAEAVKANSSVGLVKNTAYKIIPINNYEEAQKWGIYTGRGDGKGRLCYTEGKYTWDDFVQGGKNRCFLLLSSDWKNIPAKATEGYPKDRYGLSMVWVFIDSFSGTLTGSNVRWNHGDGKKTYSKVDQMFTPAEITHLLGMNFEQAFGIKAEANPYRAYLKFFFENPSMSRMKAVQDFLKDFCPVNNYTGFVFYDNDGKLYYAKSADDVQEIPASASEIVPQAESYILAGGSAEKGYKVYDFNTEKVRNIEDSNSFDKYSVYGGTLFMHSPGWNLCDQMFYVRNGSEKLFNIPTTQKTSIRAVDEALSKSTARQYIPLSSKAFFDFKTLEVFQTNRLPERFLKDIPGLRNLIEQGVVQGSYSKDISGVFLEAEGHVQYVSEDGKVSKFYGTGHDGHGRPLYFEPDSRYHRFISKDVVTLNALGTVDPAGPVEKTLLFDVKNHTFKVESLSSTLNLLFRQEKENPEIFKKFVGSEEDDRWYSTIRLLGKTGAFVWKSLDSDCTHYILVDADGKQHPFSIPLNNDITLNIAENSAIYMYGDKGLVTRPYESIEVSRFDRETGKVSVVGKGLVALRKAFLELGDLFFDHFPFGNLYMSRKYNGCMVIGKNPNKSLVYSPAQIWTKDRILPNDKEFFYMVTMDREHNFIVTEKSREKPKTLVPGKQPLSESLIDLVFNNKVFI